MRWHDPEQGSCTPVDLLLDAAEQTISEGVREMACRLNRGATSFAQTADHLARAAHLNVSKETLRTLIEHEGREVLKRQQQGVLSPEWTASDCQTTDDKTRVYLGCDGVMVPLITDTEKRKRRAKVKQKRQRCGKRCRPLPKCQRGADQAYKEFKLGVLYDETMQHRYVNVTSGNHELAGRMLKRMSDQVALNKATERIGIADGSPWIRNQIELHGLVDALGLDYYHLRENVQKARLTVYGESSAEGQQWRDELLSLFFEQGVDAAWEFLLAWQRKLRGCKRMAANQLLGYVAERRETICYPEFRRRGWQIGSGPTEAQCKSSTQRVKGRGRRWDRRNAEAIIALDCLHNSHAWQNYWLTPKPSGI